MLITRWLCCFVIWRLTRASLPCTVGQEDGAVQGGRCYYPLQGGATGPNVTYGVTWEAANDVCQQAQVTKEVFDAIKEDVLQSYDNTIGYWLGACYNGSDWLWLDGSVLNASAYGDDPWGSGEPGDDPTDTCIRLRRLALGVNYVWEADARTEANFAVCYQDLPTTEVSVTSAPDDTTAVTTSTPPPPSTATPDPRPTTSQPDSTGEPEPGSTAEPSGNDTLSSRTPRTTLTTTTTPGTTNRIDVTSKQPDDTTDPNIGASTGETETPTWLIVLIVVIVILVIVCILLLVLCLFYWKKFRARDKVAPEDDTQSMDEFTPTSNGHTNGTTGGGLISARSAAETNAGNRYRRNGPARQDPNYSEEGEGSDEDDNAVGRESNKEETPGAGMGQDDNVGSAVFDNSGFEPEEAVDETGSGVNAVKDDDGMRDEAGRQANGQDEGTVEAAEGGLGADSGINAGKNDDEMRDETGRQANGPDGGRVEGAEDGAGVMGKEGDGDEHGGGVELDGQVVEFGDVGSTGVAENDDGKVTNEHLKDDMNGGELLEDNVDGKGLNVSIEKQDDGSREDEQNDVQEFDTTVSEEERNMILQRSDGSSLVQSTVRGSQLLQDNDNESVGEGNVDNDNLDKSDDQCNDTVIENHAQSHASVNGSVVSIEQSDHIQKSDAQYTHSDVVTAWNNEDNISQTSVDENGNSRIESRDKPDGKSDSSIIDIENDFEDISAQLEQEREKLKVDSNNKNESENDKELVISTGAHGHRTQVDPFFPYPNEDNSNGDILTKGHPHPDTWEEQQSNSDAYQGPQGSQGQQRKRHDNLQGQNGVQGHDYKDQHGRGQKEHRLKSTKRSSSRNILIDVGAGGMDTTAHRTTHTHDRNQNSGGHHSSYSREHTMAHRGSNKHPSSHYPQGSNSPTRRGRDRPESGNGSPRKTRGPDGHSPQKRRPDSSDGSPTKSQRSFSDDSPCHSNKTRSDESNSSPSRRHQQVPHSWNNCPDSGLKPAEEIEISGESLAARRIRLMDMYK